MTQENTTSHITPLARSIDLNANVGEGFDGENSSHDEKVIKRLTSANIACGFHGGDPAVMARSVDFAIKYDVAIGAHIGLPDLLGFGSSSMKVSPKKVRFQVLYQLGALQAFAQAKGKTVQHVKLQGILYEQAVLNPELAKSVAEAIASVDQNIILLGLAGSEMIQAGSEAGLRTAAEFWADRNYDKEGTLVSSDAEIDRVNTVEECVQRTLEFVKTGCVKAITGEVFQIQADSIAVCGEDSYAVQLLDEIKRGLHKQGVETSALAQLDLS